LVARSFCRRGSRLIQQIRCARHSLPLPWLSVSI